MRIGGQIIARYAWESGGSTQIRKNASYGHLRVKFLSHLFYSYVKHTHFQSISSFLTNSTLFQALMVDHSSGTSIPSIHRF